MNSVTKMMTTKEDQLRLERRFREPTTKRWVSFATLLTLWKFQWSSSTKIKKKWNVKSARNNWSLS